MSIEEICFLGGLFGAFVLCFLLYGLFSFLGWIEEINSLRKRVSNLEEERESDFSDNDI